MFFLELFEYFTAGLLGGIVPTISIGVSSTSFSNLEEDMMNSTIASSVASVSTTAIGGCVKGESADILQTQAYIESMNEQELSAFINKLENVDVEFVDNGEIVSVKENPKVYSKKFDNKI